MEKEKKETKETKEPIEKTKKTKKLVIPVIVAALLLCSVGGYFVYQKTGKKDNVTGTTRYVGDEYWVSISRNNNDPSLYIMKGSGEAQKVVEKREKIKVTFSPATAYKEKHVKFLARPITGLNEDGTFKLGAWSALICVENFGPTVSREWYIHGKYAEFAFSFDILGGTDWPYSDVFWTVDDGPVKDINIDWGGTTTISKIKIEVNGNTIVNQKNLPKHKEKELDPYCK